VSQTISQSLLPEFDREVASTRKTLERVPEGRSDFRPHPKSMTLARLAGHLAEIPTWATVTLAQNAFDVNPPGGGQQPQAYVMTTRQALLQKFDDEVGKARALLVSTDDASMSAVWTLKNGGQIVMTMPRMAVFRSFIVNHMIHHRAQLGVYLRMNDVPVPSIYGPSADEGSM
jgi:uncharacterized damage-inducible protein DinB